MKQQNLEAANQHIRETLQMYVSELITDMEFARAMAEMYEAYKMHKPQMIDLIDPNTGLRYE